MVTPALTGEARPCIVLGLETQIGLALVRELGQAGVPVIGIAHDVRAIGLRSRHLSEGIVVEAPRSERLLQVIREIGARQGPCSLLTVSEANLSWLAAHRHELGAVHAAVPEAPQLAAVLDKARTLALAQELGIDVPATIEPTDLASALSAVEDLRFPQVLKWKDPNAVAPHLRAAGLPLLKTEYVHDRQQWGAAMQRYAPLAAWPLAQAYCPGTGLGQFFFMHRGQAIRRFQHVRVAEWPPEGGFSSVCDAVDLREHEALQAKSIALLQRIGWEGVAMVEYRWDPATGRAVLMEINGRFWGSYPLAMQAGAGFARLAHAAALDLPMPALPPPKVGLRCRMVSTEIKRLVRIGLQPGRIADPMFVRRPVRELLRFVADFLRPGVCYYVWSAADPRPWLRDVANLRPGR